ncbi:PadR family transcriptional regulator [Sporomusa acidovorans]|uniref:Transcriptional regulator PadR-like family protein n=1 Tax=Sporomusa acidovorans (strain ATCC 49682 / DSM 3132 / Mol) TaxID=1123286 RepID=A0ABZ3J5J1_SPOA4|nr:PadR family transcriptional regulator [Sporomusa acidovorans]OZC23512.1 transcriptional regulator PadR-like family protein [Sporomusa acidovorans DSM 3132]SDF47712.1 transcriptional regulator, PadR family [Sporomusa acidovorans]
MNILSYAILGLINKEKLTGYDLTKIFNDSVADFWSANQSQIYPELKKLVQAGLIEYEVVIQGEILEKKLYSITPEGKTTLKKWILEDDPVLPQSKDIFKLRIYFAEHLNKEQLLGKLTKRQQKCTNLLKRYQIKFNDYQNIPVPPIKLGDYILLKGAMAQLEAQLVWLDESIDYINSIL